jgi:methyl-accepting chemotaxis protein
MKLKIKLSLMVIAIVAVIVTVVGVILLRQASDISLTLAKQSMRNLTIARVEYWKGREEGNLKILKTLADVMADYESTPADTRRERFDAMLKSTLLANSNMAAIYTVWK